MQTLKSELRTQPKRWLALLLSVVMLLALSPAHVFAAPVNSGVRFDMVTVDSAAGVYKLVFKGKTPTTFSSMLMTLSFDNTVIKPVHRNTYADLTITHNATTPATCFNIVAIGEKEEDPFAQAFSGWKIQGTRTAFRDSFFTPKDYVTSNGSYVPIFEFYFKLQSGKTVSDIGASTFNYEGGSGTFLPDWNPGGDTAGVTIVSEGTIYRWGCSDQINYPDTIDELINPFVETDILTVKITEDNAEEIFKDYEIVCEAFDSAESKAILVNYLLSQGDKKIIAASGMTGYGSANKIITKRALKNLYICGDSIPAEQDGIGFMAPRVMVCAGHQANMILRLLLEEKTV